MSTDYALHERIDAVSNAEAEEDRLVTYAVPPDRPIEDARERIEEEHARADYIDSDETSTRLTDALETVRRTLHEYEETPENGLVVYAGTVDGEGVVHAFDDLPSPVPDSQFRVGNEFAGEPLEAAAEPSATHGLLVVERGGAALGRLVDGEVEPERVLDSDVMGKTRAGGQSAERFERERERQKEEFFETVADEASRAFLEGTSPETGGTSAEVIEDSEREGSVDAAEIDSLFLGGTTVTVDEFLEGEYLDHRLRDRVEGGTFAVEYSSERGLHQLVEKARDHLEATEHRGEREAPETFFSELGSGGDVAYGPEEVEEALEYDAVETALVSEDLDASTVRELEERTIESGGEFVAVSDDLERGVRLREGFGGAAAALRFPID